MGAVGFRQAAGLVFLTLIPAIRRGRAYLRANGSPWPWPFYPWSVFVSSGRRVRASVPARWSFQPLPDLSERIIFAPYFLVPFGLAIAVLVLEIAIVERIARRAGSRGDAARARSRSRRLVTDRRRFTRSSWGISRRGWAACPCLWRFIAAGGFYLYGFMRRASG